MSISVHRNKHGAKPNNLTKDDMKSMKKLLPFLTGRQGNGPTLFELTFQPTDETRRDRPTNGI